MLHLLPFVLYVLISFACVKVKGVQTTLTGQSFKFTVIHEPPYVDVGVNDGVILPKSEWKGYIIDMIAIIAQKAGFDYELFLPSGSGSGCPAGATDIELSNKYLCGQQDTLDLNLTHAYWSQFYVTKGRVEGGTSFTSPFLTDVGLGLLILPEDPSTFESFSLLFTPFSWEMWVTTLGVCVFVAIVVWFTEIVEGPSRHAHRTITTLTSTVYRKTDPAQIEQFFNNDGEGKGILDKRAYALFPRYFLGTFSGLMNASDDSEKDDGRVTPSGPFASAWCFFVLFWASAYTANLAATLTTSNARASFESVDHLAKMGATVCAKGGAAYTIDLISTYPNLDVRTYSSMSTMVSALQAGDCSAVVESYAGINGIANGVTDLDFTEERNFCDVEHKMILAGEPLKLGLTDMAVGVHSMHSTLREVIDYWIVALRTCSPSDVHGACPKSGLGGGVNLEVLREQHVEQANCGDSHLANAEPIVLGIENFFFPLLTVLIAGVVMLVYYSIKYLQNMPYYFQAESLESILNLHDFHECFREIRPGRSALMLDQMFRIVHSSDNENLRLKLIKSAARHYLTHDLKSFYALVRLGDILYPGHFENNNDPGDTTRLKLAGKTAHEVEASVDLLIIRAVSQLYQENGRMENFTFVCRDDIQFEKMKKAGWGEKVMSVELELRESTGRSSLESMMFGRVL